MIQIADHGSLNACFCNKIRITNNAKNYGWLDCLQAMAMKLLGYVYALINQLTIQFISICISFLCRKGMEEPLLLTE